MILLTTHVVGRPGKSNKEGVRVTKEQAMKVRSVRYVHTNTVNKVLIYRKNLQRPGATLWERDECRRCEGMIIGIERVIDMLKLSIDLPARGSFTITS